MRAIRFHIHRQPDVIRAGGFLDFPEGTPMNCICVSHRHRHSHEVSVALWSGQHVSAEIKELPVGNRGQPFKGLGEPLVRKPAKHYVVLEDQDVFRPSSFSAPHTFEMAQAAALVRVGVDDGGNALDSIEYPDGAEGANSFLPSVRPAVEINAVNQIEELKRVTKCQLHPASDSMIQSYLHCDC